MENDQEDISLLIFKDIKHELTEEERARLERWKQERKERRELADEFGDKKLVYEYLQLYASFQPEQAWEKVRRFCGRRRLSPPSWLLKVAVVVLFLGIGGIYLLQQEEHTPQEAWHALNDIHPGSNQAVLILENGEKVELENIRRTTRMKADRNWEVNRTGELSYKSKDSGKPVAPGWHILRVPVGGEYKLQLADGTQMWMNSESELRYPVYFGEGERRVKLTGQAFFKVSADSSKAFVVETAPIEIRVFGTSFDVMAYEEEKFFTATLVEGKVEVQEKQDTKGGILLRPGEQVRGESGKLQVRKVDTEIYTAWIQGRFAFAGEPLEVVLRKLGRWYNVRFEISDKHIRQRKFTGSVSRYSDVSKILEMLELTTDIHFCIQDNRIVVEG